MLDGITVPFAALWVILAFAAGCVAEERGRGFLRWFLLSLVTSSILTIPLLLALPRKWVVPKKQDRSVHFMNATRKKKR